MKKVGIVLIVIIIFVGLGMGFLSLLKPRTALTQEDFVKVMEAKEYTMVDAKNQFEEVDYVESAMIALKDNHQLEFYILSNDNYAEQFFLNNKEIFESEKSGSSASTIVNFTNGSKFTLSTNGKYKNVTRIDNTVLYFDVDESLEDVVKEIVKEINY